MAFLDFPGEFRNWRDRHGNLNGPIIGQTVATDPVLGTRVFGGSQVIHSGQTSAPKKAQARKNKKRGNNGRK